MSAKRRMYRAGSSSIGTMPRAGAVAGLGARFGLRRNTISVVLPGGNFLSAICRVPYLVRGKRLKVFNDKKGAIRRARASRRISHTHGQTRASRRAHSAGLDFHIEALHSSVK